MNHVSQSPSVLVAGGNSGSWHFTERLRDSAWVSGIESWVYATKGRYKEYTTVTPDDVCTADVVIMNLNAIEKPGTMRKVRELAESRPAHVRWVTLLEGDMRSYLKPLPHLRELFDASTFVNCINVHAHDFFASLTSTPVHTLGIPYPAEGVRACSTPMEQRHRSVHICPFLRTRWSEYAVARQLHMPVRGFERRVSRSLRRLWSNYHRFGSATQTDINKQFVRSMYNTPPVDVSYEMWFDGYYAHASSSWIWLNLDDRYTWGRFVLDAAALGVPIISTASTGHARVMFPDTTVDTPFDVQTAVRYAQRLCEDVEFYKSVTETAWNKVQELRPELMTQRLWTLLGLQ